ncbi:hypothetical protein LJR034_004674 [Caballeronia sp. LjRoot34]|uniref:hypothetical protein n=1 Tax=Caballeronia sp. LjRoot34 TaxID=3342325 RepID=UPI003ED10496
MSRNWTKDEIETMRNIVMSGKSLKRNMHLLPGRSYVAASTRCLSAGIRFPKVIERILMLMSDEVPRTAVEISKLLGLPRKSVSDALRHAVHPDDLQSMHVCGLSVERKYLLYVIGEGTNVNWKPSKTENRVISDREREMDQRYRAKAMWWPRADPVVVASINAMVHAGRASA